MSLLAKEITTLLTDSVEQADAAILRRAFDRLKLVAEQPVVIGPTHQKVTVTPDLYLFTAEAALALGGHWDIARHCVDNLVEHGVTTTPAYNVRSLYVRAAVDRHDAQGMRGKELVVSVKAATALIVQGIKLSLADPTLYHLVNAGADHLWNTVRLLYHDGTMSEIVSAIGFAVQALEKIEMADVKARAVWQFRYATVLASSGRGNDALAAASKASDLAAKGAPQLKYWAFRTNVGLQLVAPNPKIKADARGVMKGIYAAHSVLCGAVDEAAAEPDIVASINEIGAELAAALRTKDAGGADERPSPTAKGGKAAAAKGGKGAADAPAANASVAELDAAAREETYAELGLAAAYVGQLKLASDVANQSASSKRLIARVYADYAKALVQATQAGGIALQDQTDFSFCAPETAQELLNAVRRIDRAIESALRVPAAADRNFLVQQGAILCWNLSLPLLQPTTRNLVAKSLQTAVRALDEIESNLTLLRAQMHLEVATSDADAQLVTKAATRVEQALQLDYKPPAGHAKLYSLSKPLDRYLTWLQRSLRVKGLNYSRPDTVEDEALAILEQAADANPTARQSMISRAFTILDQSEPLSDFYVEASPADAAAEAAAQKGGVKGGKPDPKKAKAAPASGTSPTPTNDCAEGAGSAPGSPSTSGKPTTPEELEKRRALMRVRALLWGRLLALGWEGRSLTQLAICRQAAQRLLKRTWYRSGDRDMRILQANACMALADMDVAEVRKAGLTIGQKAFILKEKEGSGGNDDDDAEDDDDVDQAALEAAAAKAKMLSGLQASIQKNLVDAANIGQVLVSQDWPDQYIVCNAATALWNYFAPAYAAGDFHGSLRALEQLFPLVDQLGLDPAKETALLCDSALCFARALVQRYVKDKMGLTDSLADQITLQRVDTSTYSTFDANHAALAKAAEVCERMISILPTPMDAYRFLRLSVVIRRLQGRPAEARTDAQQRIITTVAQCSVDSSLDERRTALAQAPVTLAQDPNVELCARIAERCLLVPGCERLAIRACAIGQGLYSSGKLGHRRTVVAPAAASGAAAPKAGAKPDAKGAKGSSPSPTEAAPPAEAPPPPPTDDDWTWYALLLQYQAIAVAGLMDPSVQDKATQYEIRRQCLTALTNSSVAATRAVPERKAAIILKNVRLFAHISADLTANAPSRAVALPALKILLGPSIIAHIAPLIVARSVPGRRNASSAAAGGGDGDDGGAVANTTNPSLSNVDALAQLYLLLITAHRDARSVDAGLTTMKAALKVLPASHHKPLWALDVELRCQAGLPLNQTLLRVKEYDADTQARVWMALARHSPDRNNQLFGYQNAIQVLDSRPAEKAAHLLALAQWMLATNYDCALDEIRVVLLSAIDLVADSVDADALHGGALDAATEADGTSAGDRSRLTHRSHGGQSSGHFSRSSHQSHPTTGAGGSSDGASSVRGKAAPPSRATVKELTVVIEAYYLLARIAGPTNGASRTMREGLHDAQPPQVDGTVTDANSCLVAASHYVMRLWDTCASAAARHMHARRVKAQQAELRASQLAAVAESSGADAKDKGARGKRNTIAGSRSIRGGPPGAGGKGAAADAAGGRKPEGLLPEDVKALTLPTALEGWLTYHPSKELITTLRAMQTSPHAPSATSIPAPSAFVAVLRELSDMLHESGRSLTSLATLALTNVISQVLLAPGAYAVATVNSLLIDASRVALDAGADHAAAAHRVLNPITDVADQAALLEDARVEAARLATRPAQRHADPNADAAGDLLATPSGSIAVAAVRDSAPSFGVQLLSSAVQLRDPATQIHVLWVRMAEMLIREGRASAATTLLDEAAKHAPRYGDVYGECRIEYLRARLLALEGHIDHAVGAIRRASSLVTASIPVELLVELKAVEAELLVRQGHIDTAFALHREVEAGLQKQLSSRVGLHKAIAYAVVPGMLARFVFDFASNLVRVYSERVDTGLRPPKGLLERLRGTVVASVDRSLALAAEGAAFDAATRKSGTTRRTLPGLTVGKQPSCAEPGASACPAVVSGILAELERLEFAVSGMRASPSGRRRHLYREALRLQKGVSDLQSAVILQTEADEADGVSVRSTGQRSLADMLLRLAENKLESVSLRRAAVAAYRAGSDTAVAFPRVPGSSADTDVRPKLEATLVEFMRSTKKQRDAAQKRAQRAAQRAEVEAARSAAREEKQREIDARREQRKAEEAQAAAAGGGPAKKDATKKAGAKGAAAAIVEDPDVDPNDKCGIESPPCSEDDGDAEDSADESDDEVAHAVSAVIGADAGSTAAKDSSIGEQPGTATGKLTPDDRYVATASLGEVLELAVRAEELCGAESAAPTALRAQLIKAQAMRLIADDAVQGLEVRRAMLQGKEVPSSGMNEPFFDSVTLRGRWAASLDQAAEEPEAPAAGTAGKRAAAPAAKKGAASKQAAQATSPTPDPDAGRQSGVERTELAAKPALALQSLTVAQAAAAQAYRVGRPDLLADALFECASASLSAGYAPGAAGQLLAASHAASMENFIRLLWLTSAQGDAAEAANLRALTAMSSSSGSGVERTPFFASAVKAAYQQSPMLQRLRLPESAIASLLPSDAAATALGGVPATSVTAASPQLPADVAVLTVMARDDARVLYAVLHRGTREPEVRRCTVVDGSMAQISAAASRFGALKRAALSSASLNSGALSHDDLEAIEIEFAGINRAVTSALQPLLADFAPIFSALGAKTHLVVCLDAALQSLPIEATPLLAKFKSISRDISVFSVVARIARRSADKYAAASTAFVVDPFNEATGKFQPALFAGDEKPKTQGWTMVAPATVDGNVRSVSAATVQHALVSPANGAGTVVMALCGALANTVSLDAFAAVDFSKLRVAAVMDNAVTSASVRRESQAAMNKSDAVRFAEQPWHVGLLLLARGVDCCVSCTSPMGTETAAACMRVVAGTLEKPQMRHLAEVFRQHLQRTVPVLEPESDTVSAAKTSAPQPVEGDAFEVWEMPASDRLGLVVYGVSPDDAVPSADGKKK